jgi:ribonuclease BN (tRNA processing enzyme)
MLRVDGVPRVLVDVGPGAFVRLGETRLPQEQLDTILLTHLHVDHAADLPGLIKSRDLVGEGPLTFRVYGPEAGGLYPSTTDFADRLFGGQGAFAYLASFRNPLNIRATDVEGADAAAQLLSEDGLVVTAVAVDHGDVPALAYRVSHRGHSVVFSGDLASRQDGITTLAAGADLLIYDAAVLDPPGSPQGLYALHTPPRRIGEVARAAGVRSVLLGHVPPAVEARAREVLDSVAASFGGPVRFAEDCMQMSVGGER